MSKIVRTVVLVATASLLAACGSAGPAPSSGEPAVSATIRGTLMTVGGPYPGTPRPISGQVAIVNTVTHVRREVSVGADGRFAISVAPGTYQLLGRSTGYEDGTWLCDATASVKAMAKSRVLANVYCQMR